MEHPSTPAGGQPANLPAETSATFNATAEIARLRKTIALAEEAIRCAADHRHRRHADGETIEETTLRWNEATAIEDAAKDCRKAARKALASVAVFRDVHAPVEIAAKIEAARAAALGLKAVIDESQRANANRQIRVFARQIAAAMPAVDAAIKTAAARRAQQKGGSR